MSTKTTTFPPAEAQCVSAIIEECVEKLALLTSVTPDVSSRRDELGRILGDDITKTLTKQKDLENKFATIVKEKEETKAVGLYAERKKKAQEYTEVVEEIKVSTHHLQKALKDNPNVADNLVRLRQERSTLHTLLQKTIRELRGPEHTFNDLWDEITQQNHDINKREQMLASYREKMVEFDQLTGILENNRALQEKELSNNATDINELKKELQELKTKYEKEKTYFQANEDARTKCLDLLDQQKLSKQQEVIRNLEEQYNTENTVFDRNMAYLQERTDFLVKEASKWQERQETDRSSVEYEIRLLLTKQDERMEILSALRTRQKEEFEEQQRKELEEKKKQEEALMMERIEKFRKSWCGVKIVTACRELLKGKKKKKKSKKGKGKKSTKKSTK
eukprot:TRINITY_DN2999_c0_g1_i4.p1 TRINITY_DN2999_c0_g1~~TRINITY_DN2999_c0_g1_i4.p1  ORF type:complete len:393 (+),score=132.57 TRINITY_DN2999_c0_g1_i4:65-1243(+)